MVEDQGKPEEAKFDFTREGEALGYISLDQARLDAVQTGRSEPGNYGRRWRNVPMVYEVVEDQETEDDYIIILSFRPEGDFTGTPGREQFVFRNKIGEIAFRQVLTVPSRRRSLPIIPAAAALAVVGAIAVIAVFAAGGFDEGSDSGAAVPAAQIAVLAPTSAAGIAPAVEATATPTPAAAVLSTATPLPTPTPMIQVVEKEVVVTATPGPAPTDTDAHHRSGGKGGLGNSHARAHANANRTGSLGGCDADASTNSCPSSAPNTHAHTTDAYGYTGTPDSDGHSHASPHTTLGGGR